MEWNVSYGIEQPSVWFDVELTEPLPEGITCRDLYLLLQKKHLIKRYPRKFKKAFYFGTKNSKVYNQIKSEINKYCKV